MDRKPLFAGQWYPASQEQQKRYLSISRRRIDARAIVVPHAGWIYSGRVAGMTFGAINPADIFILIGPNHTGLGQPVAIYPTGKWLLSEKREITVDSEIADQIIKNSQYAREDILAHQQEHSLEVQVPFIYLVNPSAKIVPIVLADYRQEVINDLAEAIAEVLKRSDQTKNKIVLVASTDLSHYLPQSVAEKLDHLAIESIRKMNATNLLETVVRNNITMCGAGPVAVVLKAVSTIYPEARAELIKYTTSAEVSGETDSVVGYAGLVIF